MSNPLLGAAASMAAANPANAPERAPRQRIPMALPTLKLNVPEIPGYVCYWFRGTSQRITQAINAGYTFVERGEVELNHPGLADSYDKDGNSDMGTRVSVPSGGDADVESSGGRLYLMKIKKELWNEDQQLIEDRHEKLAAQLRGDKGIAEAGMDTSNRYSRGESRNLFQPRRAR